MSFNPILKKDRDFLKLLFYIIQPSHVVRPTEDGRSMTTFYYCSVNHQSEKHTLKLSHILLMSIKMCHKLCHFIWGAWWFHRSKDFEAMKAEKTIRPWLSCPYNKNTLLDLSSFVVWPRKYLVLLGFFKVWSHSFVLTQMAKGDTKKHR